MDVIDLLWNTGQDRQLREVHEQVNQIQSERASKGVNIRELLAENAELRLRLGLLVRLLISKGVFNAEEFAAHIAETQSNVEDIRE